MRKLFSLFAALTLSVGLWAETVSYLYPVYKTDGDPTSGIKEWKTTTVDATEVTSATSAVTWGTAGNTTWYIVKGTDVQLSEGAICAGDVRLILADNAKLTATGDDDAYTPGIQVSGEGNSLTIYAQSTGEQMGRLIADATDTEGAAGIGGGDMGSGSNITINGGEVTATGGMFAAGIGGGNYASGSNITINGGIVEATGGMLASGIGGGFDYFGSDITINGGDVTATGGEGAAGIGGGESSSGSNITINGGTVEATGGMNAAGIGGGEEGPASDIFVATNLIVKAGTSADPTTEIAKTRTATTDIANDLAGKQYATVETPVATSYINENGEEQEIVAAEVENASTAVTWGTAGNTTWYVVKGANVQLSKGAICAGDVRLILADNAKLTATGGINVTGTNSLTIYAQSTGTQMGQLSANSGSMIAGIGGGDGESSSNITINGGTVEATGGSGAAGIGGGRFASGSNITINGGTVEATGGSAAAGIGGGNQGTGSNITINGGTITANNGSLAAGIGGGNEGNGSNIIINGGTITANGGNMAVGIGGGRYGTGSNIYISDAYILKAGATANPTDVIDHSSATDLASTLTQQYVKIEGLAMPYTRSMTIDNWATVCLPYAATSFEGADFYKINYYNESEQALYVESVETLEAGKPYIFQATATTVTINHSATAPMDYSEAGVLNNLYGSFARTTIAYDAEHKYAAIANDKVNVIASENEITIPACRAYIDMKDVPTTEQPHAAPLRRMGGARPMPTDLETVHGSQCTMHDGKYIINGQFVIVKDGKTYNAQGTLVD